MNIEKLIASKAEWFADHEASVEVNIPPHAIPHYLTAQWFKGISSAYLIEADLDVASYLHDGQKRTGIEAAKFYVGDAVLSTIKNLYKNESSYPDVEQTEALLASITAMAGITEHMSSIGFLQPHEPEELLKKLVSGAQGKTILLPFLMCPDTDYQTGNLKSKASENRKSEIDTLKSLAEVLQASGISCQILVLIGNDWFHPSVRQNIHNPTSGDQKIVRANMADLQTHIETHILADGTALSEVLQLGLLTEMKHFTTYMEMFVKFKNWLVHPKFPLSAKAKKYLQQAKGKTTFYYEALHDSEELLTTMVIDDLALYMATMELFEMLNEDVVTAGGAGVVAVSMEADKASAQRYLLWEKQRNVVLLNLSARS